MEVAIIVIIVFLIYFLPSIIGNGKRNGCAIFVLNLFLGWTLIGWVVALVWACCQETEVNVNIQNEPKIQKRVSNKYDELERLADLKNKGVISEYEFNEQKQSILGVNVEAKNINTKSKSKEIIKNKNEYKTVSNTDTDTDTLLNGVKKIDKWLKLRGK